MSATRAVSIDLANTTTAYPGTPQLNVGFDVKRWIISHNGTNADIVIGSFDGKTDHIIFNGSGPFDFRNTQSKLWLRSAAAGALKVLVTAENSSW